MLTITTNQRIMKKTTFVIMMLFTAANILAQTAIAPSAGNGSKSNPYQIASLENLYWIAASNAVVPDPNQAARLTAHYTQINNIDAAATATWFSGQGWIPIGDPSNPFNGSYNGKGYVISNIFIDRPAENCVGFFALSSNLATLKNIGLVNVQVTGLNSVGGLCGENSLGTVNNCFTTGNVIGTSMVGGLIGMNWGEWQSDKYLIRKSYSLANVSSINSSGGYIGGLLGGNWDAKISDCYSRGSVSGLDAVGGLVGFNEWSTVKNCYSTGLVDFTIDGGGLIGGAWQSTVTKSYWNTQTSGQSSSYGGDGRSTSEMTYTSGPSYGSPTYVNWSSSIWKDDVTYLLNDGYPYLKMLSPPDNVIAEITVDETIIISWEEPTPRYDQTLEGYKVYRQGLQINPSLLTNPPFTDNSPIVGLTTYEVLAVYTQGESEPSDPLPVSYANAPAIGSGTAADPYQITSPSELYWLVHSTVFENNNLSGIHFLQTQNINLSSAASWDNGKGWLPIGKRNGTSFSGTYNGNGKLISGLFINRTDENMDDGIGLFGSTHQANIHDLGLILANVSGGLNVGGLAGHNNATTITNCFVDGAITGLYNTGGLVGENKSYSAITASYSAGSVSSTGNYVGGLVGLNNDHSSIVNCYSTAHVAGEAGNVGGLAGDLYGSSSVSYCYSMGAVTGSYNTTGGLLGYIWSGTASNSYWDTESSGRTTSWGGSGVMGRTTAQMTFPYASNTYTGWDFTNVWVADDDYTMNNGYPYFTWQTNTDFFAGGNGSESDPWQIATPEHLNNVRYFIGAGNHFIQIADIDLNVAPWNMNAGWVPIGLVSGDIYSYQQSEAFNGTFDGGGYSISNLFISSWNFPAQNGLFAFLGLNATVKNVNLVNVNLDGFAPMGPIAAYNDGIIQGCRAGGLIFGGQSNTGGIAGTNNGTISKCYSNCDISGGTNVGGLVGWNWTDATLSDAYTDSEVNGGNICGGIVGWNDGTIERCYTSNTAAIDYPGGFVGPICSGFGGGGTKISAYWHVNAYGLTEPSGDDGKTTSQMQQQATFIGWNFATVWGIIQNQSFPFLTWQTPPVTAYQISAKVWLEGPFDGTQMTTTLNTDGLIPLSQPYNSAPWNYNGTENVAALPPDVTDWVLIELRDAADPGSANETTTIHKMACFVRNDGQIVALDGTSNPSIGNPAVTQNLYIVVRHRNHIDVLSANALTLTGNTYTYDFSTALAQAHGAGAGYKEIAAGVFGMAGGDTDADGKVFASDFVGWATDSGLQDLYSPADMDFDGNVFASDFVKWAGNSGLDSPVEGGDGEVVYISQVPDEVKTE